MQESRFAGRRAHSGNVLMYLAVAAVVTVVGLPLPDVATGFVLGLVSGLILGLVIIPFAVRWVEQEELAQRLRRRRHGGR